jgi:hypothetical protein
MPKDHFPPEVAEQLQSYVYLLRDPRDRKLFYVGKGTGDRVFAHARDAAAIPEESVKQQKIQLIHEIHHAGHAVITEFLRFGLDAMTAYEVEAAAIDLVGVENLLNEVDGHASNERGFMRTDAAFDLAADPVEITVAALLIRPSRQWSRDLSMNELYEATRKWWVLGPKRARAKYALAVANGIVRGAWRIDEWVPRGPGDDGAEADTVTRTRWGFIGSEAPELNSYLGKSVRHIWKKGAQSPVRYQNCG